MFLRNCWYVAAWDHEIGRNLLRRVIFLASDAARPALLEFASTTGNLLMGKPFRLDAMRDALRRLFPDPLGKTPDPATGSVH